MHAQKIWDSGIGLSAWINRFALSGIEDERLSDLKHLLFSDKKASMIELGMFRSIHCPMPTSSILFNLRRWNWHSRPHNCYHKTFDDTYYCRMSGYDRSQSVITFGAEHRVDSSTWIFRISYEFVGAKYLRQFRIARKGCHQSSCPRLGVR